MSASMMLRAVPRTVVLDLQAYSNASSVTVLDKPVVVSSTADGIGPYTQPLASGLTYQYSAAGADVPLAQSNVALHSTVRILGYTT